MPTGDRSPQPADPLAAVVGRNFKTIRGNAGATLNDVAKNARTVGLRWTASKVGDFEAGRSTPSFATVIAAAQALTIAAGREVSVSELVTNTGLVEVTESLALDGVSLTGALCGGQEARVQKQRNAAVRRVERATAMVNDTPAARSGAVLSAAYVRVVRGTGLDEQRLAKRLNISADKLAEVSARLWGRSFSDERDRRAGDGANAQKRGRIARGLQNDVRTELGLN